MLAAKYYTERIRYFFRTISRDIDQDKFPTCDVQNNDDLPFTRKKVFDNNWVNGKLNKIEKCDALAHVFDPLE